MFGGQTQESQPPNRPPVRGNLVASDFKSLPLHNVEALHGRYPISQPLSPVSPSCLTSGSQSPADHTDHQQRITWGQSPEPTEEVDPAPSLLPENLKKQQASDLNAWHAVQAAVQAASSSGSGASREREIKQALAGLEPGSAGDREMDGSGDAAQARYDRACDLVISPQHQAGGSAPVIRGEAFTDVRQPALAPLAEIPKTSALTGQDSDSKADAKEQGPTSETSPRLPTANELRKGLVELQSLLVDLKDQRRAREEPALQAEGQAASEEQHELLQALRAELYEEREERRNLQEELAYSENSEKHCAGLVEELQTQICMERGNHASELSTAAQQEAAAVAGLRDEFQSERRALRDQLTAMQGQEAVVASATDKLTAECGHLNAELAESSRSMDQPNVAEWQSRCKSLSSEAADLASALNAAKAVARHEAAAVGQLRAEQAAAMAELHAERDQLILQEEAAATAQVALQQQQSSSASAVRSDSGAPSRREHQLRTSLAATENQLQMLRNSQHKESSRMEMQADSLERELEHGKLVAAQHWKRSVELEADVERLTEENKRLHELLIAELAAADSLHRSPSLLKSKTQDPALVSFEDRRARFNTRPGAQDVENQSQASKVSTPSGPPPNRVPIQRPQSDRAAAVGASAEDEEPGQEPEMGSGDAAAGGTQSKRRAESMEAPLAVQAQEESIRAAEVASPKGKSRQALVEQQTTLVPSRPAVLGGSLNLATINKESGTRLVSPMSPKARPTVAPTQPQRLSPTLHSRKASRPPSQVSSVSAPSGPPLEAYRQSPVGSAAGSAVGTPSTRPGMSHVRMMQISGARGPSLGTRTEPRLGR